MNLCTANSCGLPTGEGDVLFCKPHRERWRGFCKINGIEHLPLPRSEVEPYLKEFRENTRDLKAS